MRGLVVLFLAILLGACGIISVVSAGNAADDTIVFPRPGSHRGNWPEFHGKASAAQGYSTGRPDRACLTCHERNDCMACHITIMPRDHNNFWRTRAHGLMAGANRERCSVCHQQDYCIRCHSETAPRSHTARWRTQHCTWCHFSSRLAPTDNCRICHTQAQHISAPHPVSAALNCLQCHR